MGMDTPRPGLVVLRGALHAAPTAAPSPLEYSGHPITTGQSPSIYPTPPQVTRGGCRTAELPPIAPHRPPQGPGLSQASLVKPMCFSFRGSEGHSQNSYWCLGADEDRRDAGWRSKGHHNLLLLPPFASLARGYPAHLLPYLLGMNLRPRSDREEASLPKTKSTGTLQWPSDCPP